jgi:hypothetical protein
MKTSTTKYPHITIQLEGEDGNAFSILGRVTRAMKRAGVERSEIDAFTAEATSGDYDNLLRTVMSWVSFDIDPDEDEDYNPNACADCGEKYAVGGCPACGDDH